MKLVDVISHFDKVRPNTFEFKLKKTWLLKIESDLKEFVSKHSQENVNYNFLSEENPEMLLSMNDIDIYVYYMSSMADITNGEYSLYNISSTYFNGVLNLWKRKYRSEHMPTEATKITV